MTDRKSPPSLLGDAIDRIETLRTVKQQGRVTELTGMVIKAHVPGVRVGDVVRIIAARERGDEGLPAEVVGFLDDRVVLMPLGHTAGIGPECLVAANAEPLTLRCGTALLGRVLDGLGRPIDGGPPLDETLVPWPVDRPAPAPLARPRIREPLSTGLRAVDGLLTVGEGQRIGLFAGSGVGKSTLLGQIARHASAEVNVVCLVGERGREVREFIDESLGDGLAKSVVICATSDQPPLVRMKSPLIATAVAEYFRDQQGCRVLLLMDSITRYARALREVGLASGEPPARRGYPPSVFAALPRLLERTGTAPRGSITAIYTVLVEGSDMEEPIADEVRGILDGHFVLDRSIAERNHYPAIDVLRSLSRVMPAVTSQEHRRAANTLRRVLSSYERQRDFIVLGAYQRGSDRLTDYAIAKLPAIEAFLCQRPDEHTTLESAADALCKLVADAPT